jgi:4-carboxymuconolactone decarboxylase
MTNQRDRLSNVQSRVSIGLGSCLMVAGLAGCTPEVSVAPEVFAAPTRLSAPRLAPFEEDDLTREHLLAMGTDPDNPDGRPRMNLFRTMMHNAELMDHWRHFGDYVNASDSISARDKELLIMRLAWIYYSEYEWGAHYNTAINVGLTAEQIEQTKVGPESELWDEFDRAWLRAAGELVEDAFVSDDTWNVLTTRYNESQLMHMFATVAHYHLVAMLTNTLGIQRDAFLERGF